MFLLRFTIVNEKYVKNQLEKTSYFDKLKETIDSDFEDYLRPSGLPFEVVENIYTKEDIKKEVNNVVDSLYGGKKITIDTKKVQDNLNKNIEEYLRENNIEISDQASLDKFTSEVIKIYQKNILLVEKIDSLSKPISKAVNLFKIVFIIVLAIIIILGLTIRKVFHKSAFLKPLMASGILLLITNYILFQKIDIYHILFWNDAVSKIIQNIFFDFSKMMKYSGISLIVLFLLVILIIFIKNKRKI